MKLSFLLTLIAPILFLAVESSKPGPVPGSGKTVQQNAGQTQPDDSEGKPKETPAKLEIAAASKDPSRPLESDAKSKQATDERGIKITDILLAGFTFLLVIVGATQAYFLYGALGVTKKAADAARDSADTLIRQNSPYLRLSGLTLEAETTDRPYPRVVYTLRNYGGGRGFLTEMSNDILLTSEPLPDIPQYRDVTPYSPVGISLGHMDSLPIPVAFPSEIRSIQDLSYALESKRRLFVYGYVKCSDTLHQTHTFGFGYEYAGHRFVLTGGEAYNYRRCEQETHATVDTAT